MNVALDLAALGDRVAPLAMAHERTLPVPDALGGPAGGAGAGGGAIDPMRLASASVEEAEVSSVTVTLDSPTSTCLTA